MVWVARIVEISMVVLFHSLTIQAADFVGRQQEDLVATDRLGRTKMSLKIFHSFHYEFGDVWRVNQLRNVGALEGNSGLEPNEWEKVKKSEESVRKWFKNQIDNSDCVMVMVGSKTSERKFVKEEIKYAFENSVPMFGVYIHTLLDRDGNAAIKGANPFAEFNVKHSGLRLNELIDVIPLPIDSKQAYAFYKENAEKWVRTLIKGGRIEF